MTGFHIVRESLDHHWRVSPDPELAIPSAGTPQLPGLGRFAGHDDRHRPPAQHLHDAEYCAEDGVPLPPHGKSTMSPERSGPVRRGRWGINVATAEHLRGTRAFGIPRILLANKLVDPIAIRVLAAELAADPDFQFVCYVESVEGVELLETGLGVSELGDFALDVVVELGVAHGRTGFRTVERALAVAVAASKARRVRVIGVAGTKGPSTTSGARTPSLPRGGTTVAPSLARAEGRQRRPVGPGASPRLGAGAALFYDLVVEALAGARSTGPGRSSCCAAVRTSPTATGYTAGSLRSGSQSWTYRFRPAFRLWGRVLSRPESELAIADFGRRDTSVDQGMPIPVETRAADSSAGTPAEGFQVTGLNNQHAFVRLPAEPPRSGGLARLRDLSSEHCLRQVGGDAGSRRRQRGRGRI